LDPAKTVREDGREDGRTTATARFPVQWFEQEIAKHLVKKPPQPQYERLETLFPAQTEKFVKIALDAARNPLKYRIFIDSILDAARERISTVCGSCQHSRDDRYRAGTHTMVCWEAKPPSQTSPLKILKHDKKAVSCSGYSPKSRLLIENATELSGLPATVFSKSLNDSWNPDRQAFALRMAMSITWRKFPWLFPFNKSRESSLFEQSAELDELNPPFTENVESDRQTNEPYEKGQAGLSDFV
jgi:hypothetical protein